MQTLEKVTSFDTIVREIFAPIYPVIAEQIKAKTAVTQGHCMDAGCGTGALGRALAQITDLQITFFDHSQEMLNLARQYADQEKISQRSSFLCGDIKDILLPDQSMDLIVSRGSSPFWEDWHRAYGEILRVLKPGACAYIGGGFGNRILKDQIVDTMQTRNPNWRSSFQDKVKREREELPSILETLGNNIFQIIDDESGYWVLITKLDEFSS